MVLKGSSKNVGYLKNQLGKIVSLGKTTLGIGKLHQDDESSESSGIQLHSFESYNVTTWLQLIGVVNKKWQRLKVLLCYNYM